MYIASAPSATPPSHFIHVVSILWVRYSTMLSFQEDEVDTLSVVDTEADRR